MASSNNEIRPLVGIVNGLLNRQLQNICSTHGLRTSGVKAELQTRIKNALLENHATDLANFKRIKDTITKLDKARSSPSTTENMAGGSSSAGGYPYSQAPYGAATPAVPTPAHGYGDGTASSASGYRAATHDPFGLQFKSSPFYTIESRIGETRNCDVMSQHRNSITMNIRVGDYPALSRCPVDKSYRVMVFCAGDNHGMQDVAFPHQSELKVNGGEIKANLRGLKGKPGTTRPVDITGSLRFKQTQYANTVEFTYALTNKVKKHNPRPAQKYYLALFLCKMVAVDELVTKIRGKKIAKASVITEMTKKANDPDVVATSTVLSLKCPLSYTRLRVPCRSVLCNHVQCFDANSYLQLQEQGPQWICPICNNSAPFDNLAVDEYVRDILENTSQSLEQVTIEPDGQWKTQSSQPERKQSRYSGVSTSIDDDDDVPVVTNSRGYGNGAFGGPSGGLSAYNTPTNASMANGTPSSASREPSSAPRSGSHKRPAPEVIDLTLSSDEDDAPLVRPPKRQNQGTSFDGSSTLATVGYPPAASY
ncbi:Uu.00g058010.m01.CDS01 [Anthostomella pinea]|uniref:Uu.00g058010.m01.CDS01 n=1 Tax=Anthostomella pinea TaxID=933095 RepID=A0AAI8YJU0_9PEZI|nr:Uu.00g058010.m01.CDS01 [Anthostomella pinea]